MTWTVLLASSAVRDLDQLPPRVVPAVIEFLYGPLAENPQRVGTPLRRDLEGEWSGRRGTYRVLYRIDDTERRVVVTRIGHRSQVYRGR